MKTRKAYKVINADITLDIDSEGKAVTNRPPKVGDQVLKFGRPLLDSQIIQLSNGYTIRIENGRIAEVIKPKNRKAFYLK